MEGTRQRRESEEQLRTVKCYKCIHCKDEKGMRKMSFTDSLCAISGRWKIALAAATGGTGTYE